MRYRCKAWHEQYPDAGKVGAGTKGLEFLFAALPLALTQATVSPLRGGGAQAPDSSSLSGRRERGHGNRPCGETSRNKSLRIKAAKSRPTRSGSPPRSEGRSHLSGEGRQHERKLNSPHAQPSPYQAAKSRPVRSGPPPRSAGRSPTA